MAARSAGAASDRARRAGVGAPQTDRAVSTDCGGTLGRLASGETQPPTQPPEHLFVRLQIGAAAAPLCLNNERLDDLASVRVLDGIHRRPVSQNGEWLTHPMLPVCRHHFGNLFAHLWKFGEPLLSSKAAPPRAPPASRRSASIFSSDSI